MELITLRVLIIVSAASAQLDLQTLERTETRTGVSWTGSSCSFRQPQCDNKKVIESDRQVYLLDVLGELTNDVAWSEVMAHVVQTIETCRLKWVANRGSASEP